MAPTLPLGHELEAEWRFTVIHERNAMKSMGMSFFALPSIQGPVQGRFKPAHRPIGLRTKLAACVRRFETPTPLDYGRPALALCFRSFPYSYRISQVWARDRVKKRHPHALLPSEFLRGGLRQSGRRIEVFNLLGFIARIWSSPARDTPIYSGRVSALQGCFCPLPKPFVLPHLQR